MVNKRKRFPQGFPKWWWDDKNPWRTTKKRVLNSLVMSGGVRKFSRLLIEF